MSQLKVNNVSMTRFGLVQVCLAPGSLLQLKQDQIMGMESAGGETGQK